MSTEFLLEKHKRNKKKALFKVFVYIIIEITCLNIYLIISALSRDFDWTIERLTTTSEGIFVQILTLIATILGIIIFIQIVIYIALVLNTPDDDST